MAQSIEILGRDQQITHSGRSSDSWFEIALRQEGLGEKKSKKWLDFYSPDRRKEPRKAQEKSDGEAGKCQTSLRVPWHLGCGCAARSITGALKICSRHTFHEWSCLTQGRRSSKEEGEGGWVGEDAEEVEPSALTQRRSERR